MNQRSAPEDVQASMCATLIDELVACGLEHVVIAPGSRSTPLALAAAADRNVVVHVHHDERSAAFVALGVGLATGRPAAIVTTSGTAAVELHPAVVEADAACVPLIALTADRPPEMRDVAAPQTIDQTHLFGASVRWFHEPGVPDQASSPSWRSTAARAYAEACGPRPGPVHLNLAFREPLVGDGRAVVEPGREGGWHRRSVGSAPDPDGVAAVVALCNGTPGVIVTDDGSAGSASALARRLGWPVLAGPRAPVTGTHVVTTFDALLRDPDVAEAMRPEVVIRLGAMPASRLLAEWTPGRATHVQIGGSRWTDPGRDTAVFVDGGVGATVAALVDADLVAAPGQWVQRWQALESAAIDAIDDVLAAESGSEPAVARATVDACPPGSTLILASSMPVRDVEWYGGRRRGDLTVLANRGANGIDGVVSTGVGAAIGSSAPVTVLIGDIALLHDTNGMLGLARRDVDVKIVVVHNDGGGIFSFLPQARRLDPEVFERLFGTPHGVDIAALARVHGLSAHTADTASELAELIADRAGPDVIVVHTDRARNVEVHDRLHRAVTAAVKRSAPPR